MMTLALFQQLHTLGVVLTPSPDGTLRYKAPKGVLTPELLGALRQHKAALLAMLIPERRIHLPRYPAPCWRCKGPSERQGLRYLLCVQCQAETGTHDSLTPG
jgi:hypothetical protein